MNRTDALKRYKAKKQRHALKVITKHTNRQCGPCKACCTVMAVQSLNKGYYEPCRHECATGCAVYGKHPPECKAYFCGWLGGAAQVWQGKDGTRCSVPEDNRPDLSGVVIHVRARMPTELAGIVKPEYLVLTFAYEVWPGASEANNDWLDEIANRQPLLVVTPSQECWMFGAPELKINLISNEEWSARYN